MANKVTLDLNNNNPPIEDNSGQFIPRVFDAVKSIARPSGYEPGGGIPIIDRNLERTWKGIQMPIGINVPLSNTPSSAPISRPAIETLPSTSQLQGLTKEAQDANKEWGWDKLNQTPGQARSQLPANDPRKLPMVDNTGSFLPEDKNGYKNYGFTKAATEVMPSANTGFSGGFSGDAGMESRNRERDRQASLSRISETRSIASGILDSFVNNPRPTGADIEKAKVAMQMLANSTTAEHYSGANDIAQQTLNKPSFQKLGVGDTGFNFDPMTGTANQVASNMEPFLQKQEQTQKMALGKQASAQIHGSYNAFSKNWDAISKRYPGASEKDATGKLIDPASYKARESELRDAQTSFFSSMGVSSPVLASLPVNEQTFIEEQLSGKPGTPEKIKQLKTLHKEGLVTRKRLMDRYLRSMGYHEGNRSVLTPNPGYLPSNEEQ